MKTSFGLHRRNSDSSSTGLITLLTLIGVAGRLLPHFPNVTPLGGLANWGGSRLSKQWSYGVVFATMIISDLFLGSHPTLIYVYGALALSIWIAQRLKTVTIGKLAGITLLNAVLFFLITNFGVWYTTPQAYSHTWTGLLACYVAGLPFLRLSLAGDIAYTAIFFGLDYAVFTLGTKQTTLGKSAL